MVSHRTQVQVERPGDALLQLCVAEPQIVTRRVKDIQTNREAWHTSYDKCAARVCRIVQWFTPSTQCDADTAPEAQPAPAKSR